MNRLAGHARPRLHISLILVVVWMTAAAGAAIFFPHDRAFLPASGFWLLALSLALPAYAALELFGSWMLSFAFWSHMPGWLRILLLVTFISGGVISVVIVSQYIHT